MQNAHVPISTTGYCSRGALSYDGTETEHQVWMQQLTSLPYFQCSAFVWAVSRTISKQCQIFPKFRKQVITDNDISTKAMIFFQANMETF